MQKSIKTDVALNQNKFIAVVVTTDNFLTPYKIDKYINENYPDCTRIYTDGARTDDGRSGFAVVIPHLNYVTSMRISDNKPIDRIEIHAIQHAITLITQLNINNPLILTDSLHAVTQFQNILPTGSTDSMLLCKDLLTAHEIDLSICWIPAHIGLIEHDLVDELAKKAASKNDSIQNIIIPTVADIKARTLIRATNLWNSQIPHQKTGTVYHGIFPHGRPKSLVIAPRDKDTTITRLRLHNCFLRKYLHKIGLDATGMCERCNSTESVEHFLLECPSHKRLTDQLKDATNSLNHQLTVQNLLSNEPFISLIYSYIKNKNLKL